MIVVPVCRASYMIVLYTARNVLRLEEGTLLSLYMYCANQQLASSEQTACVRYCIHVPGNFSDVEILANLAINSFSLKLQVANLVLHCSPCTSRDSTIATILSAIVSRFCMQNLVV